MSGTAIQLAGRDAVALAGVPFDQQPRLTQIAMGIMPKGFIADMVSPRVPVPASKFAYTKFADDEFFQIPDTAIARKGEARQIEFQSADTVAQTGPYGLADLVPQQDIDEAAASGANHDPMEIAAANLTPIVRLDRERRVSRQIFSAANYIADLRVTLAGNAQWSAGASSPVRAILDAKDKMIVRPNVLVLGQAVWTKLRTHSAVIEACHMTGAGVSAAGGVVALDRLREVLELDHILVGETWRNTARAGQDVDFGRLWGNHAALLRIDSEIMGARATMPTFAFTAEWQPLMVDAVDDQKVGSRGARWIRVCENLAEILPWKSAGYFFQNAIA